MLAWLAVLAVGSEFTTGPGFLGGICRGFQVSGSFRMERTWEKVVKSSSKMEMIAESVEVAHTEERFLLDEGR